MADRKHVLLTGPIAGRVPITHEAFPDGTVDVTPAVLELDSQEAAEAVAAAIERAHALRGTHPVQLAGRALEADFPDGAPRALASAQQEQTKALDARTKE